MKNLNEMPKEIYMDVSDYGMEELELTHNNLESVGYSVAVEYKEGRAWLIAMLFKIIKIKGVEEE